MRYTLLVDCLNNGISGRNDSINSIPYFHGFDIFFDRATRNKRSCDIMGNDNIIICGGKVFSDKSYGIIQRLLSGCSSLANFYISKSLIAQQILCMRYPYGRSSNDNMIDSRTGKELIDRKTQNGFAAQFQKLLREGSAFHTSASTACKKNCKVHNFSKSKVVVPTRSMFKQINVYI